MKTSGLPWLFVQNFQIRAFRQQVLDDAGIASPTDLLDSDNAANLLNQDWLF